jgi:hypothetical protein
VIASAVAKRAAAPKSERWAADDYLIAYRRFRAASVRASESARAGSGELLGHRDLPRALSVEIADGKSPKL